MIDGRALKLKAKKFRLKPEELAVQAGFSPETIRRTFRNETPNHTRAAVDEAIEALRSKLAIEFQCRSAG